MTTLNDRINIALERSGRSRSEVADAIGITRQSLYPEGQMSADKVAKLAREFGCDWWWLATGEGEYKRHDPVTAATASISSRMSEEDRLRLHHLAVAGACGLWPAELPIREPIE